MSDRNAAELGEDAAAEAAERRLRPWHAARRFIGRVVAGKYRLKKILGLGGMGAVYEAEHILTGRRVAVKTMLEAYVSTPHMVRLLREAKAASRIGHPGIVEVLDAGLEEGAPYLVLELLKGRDLSQAMADGPLTFGEVQRVGAELCDALAAAHAAGIVHRDVKPDNVFLHEGQDGLRVKILDFGIAKLLKGPTETRLTVTGSVLGTPHYMSPEQARGDAVDARSDVWSAGALLFEAITGTPPFDGANYNVVVAQVLTDEPRRLRDVAPAVPEAIRRAIDGALERDPAKRWQSAIEMRDALADGLDVAELRLPRRDPTWAGRRLPGPARASAETVAEPSEPPGPIDVAAEAGLASAGVATPEGDSEERSSDQSGTHPSSLERARPGSPWLRHVMFIGLIVLAAVAAYASMGGLAPPDAPPHGSSLRSSPGSLRSPERPAAVDEQPAVMHERPAAMDEPPAAMDETGEPAPRMEREAARPPRMESEAAPPGMEDEAEPRERRVGRFTVQRDYE